MVIFNKSSSFYEKHGGLLHRGLSLNFILLCFREKKQKIQDIKNNIKEAIEVSSGVYVIFSSVGKWNTLMSLNWN